MANHESQPGENVERFCPECGAGTAVSKRVNQVKCSCCGSEFPVRLIRSSGAAAGGGWSPISAGAAGSRNLTDRAGAFALAEAAFGARNYEEAYQHFTGIVQNNPGDGEAWVWRGRCAGQLSRPERHRLYEMVEYTRRGFQLGAGRLDRAKIAGELALLTAWDLHRILEQYCGGVQAIRDQYADEIRNSGRDSLGAIIGHGVAKLYEGNKAAEGQAAEFGRHFARVYLEPVAASLEYVWSLSASEEVARQVKWCLQAVADCTGLGPEGKVAFATRLAPLGAQFDSAN